MTLVKNNKKLLDRKHFLLRALDKSDISTQLKNQYEAELKNIQEQAFLNLQTALKTEKDRIITKVQEAKKVIKSDGDFKRALARILISYLEQELTKTEMKGVFRQGYKIMRSEC